MFRLPLPEVGDYIFVHYDKFWTKGEVESAGYDDRVVLKNFLGSDSEEHRQYLDWDKVNFWNTANKEKEEVK